MDRYLPVFSTAVHANEAEILVRTSPAPPTTRDLIERDRYAVFSEFGPLSLYLSAAAAIELGNALIEAGHHYRSHAHAFFDEGVELAKGAAA